MNVKNDTRDLYKPLIILDSSILIKFFAKEQGDEPGTSRLVNDMNNRRVKIAILPLMYWEIGNWVCRDFSHMATEVLSAIMLCDFEEHVLDMSIMNLTVDITREHRKVTFYDASYHALAITTGGLFVTNDKAYYKAAHKLGHIKLLRDY